MGNAQLSSDEQSNYDNNHSNARSENSDQDTAATDHPDMASSEQSLVMPGDGQRLQSIINTIEADDTMCFKMRWYVARHVRDNFDATKTVAHQKFSKVVRPHHTWENRVLPGGQPYQRLVNFNPKPFSRLNFEAERAQCGFRKDQQGWQYSRIEQILQHAYEQRTWNPVITEADVDAVLEEDGVDLTLFEDTMRGKAANAYTDVDVLSSTAPRQSQPFTTSSQKQDTASNGYANHAIKQTIKESSPFGVTRDDSPRSETSKNIEALRSEVREDMRALRSETNEEIEALHSEVLQLKETVDAAMNSMVISKAAQDQSKISQDSVLSEIKKLREALDGKDSKNEDGKETKREKRKRRGKESKRSKKIRKLVKKVAEELDESSSSSDSSSSSES
jgi:hypothetical protein